MLQWILGEKRYVSITISEAFGEAFTIASSTYDIFDIETEDVVASGIANVDNVNHTCYTLWQPSEAGVYVAQFDYTINQVEGSSRQVLEVKETM